MTDQMKIFLNSPAGRAFKKGGCIVGFTNSNSSTRDDDIHICTFELDGKQVEVFHTEIHDSRCYITIVDSENTNVYNYLRRRGEDIKRKLGLR
jgi:hypothetical protein